MCEEKKQMKIGSLVLMDLDKRKAQYLVEYIEQGEWPTQVVIKQKFGISHVVTTSIISFDVFCELSEVSNAYIDGINKGISTIIEEIQHAEEE